MKGMLVRTMDGMVLKIVAGMLKTNAARFLRLWRSLQRRISLLNSQCNFVFELT